MDAVQGVVPGDAMQVHSTDMKAHSTQPPGRFSEGSLVKELEALGIGRPSTYSSIIRLLQVLQPDLNHDRQRSQSPHTSILLGSDEGLEFSFHLSTSALFPSIVL